MGPLCIQENLDLFFDGANTESGEAAKQHSTVRAKESKPLVISFELLDQPLPGSITRLFGYLVLQIPFSVSVSCGWVF